MSLLQLSNIRVSYGSVEVLHGIDLRVEEGEIVTILGANGAGKTSLLRVISGLLPVDSGNVEFDGKSITGRPAHALSRMGLIHIPQGRQVREGGRQLSKLPGLHFRNSHRAW